jgi:uncharacterized protein (DUF362 family)
MARAVVAVLKTSPETVLDDYRNLMDLARWRDFLPFEKDTLIKLNLSWTKYFPACSSEPWQLEGVLKTLSDSGFPRGRLFPVENKTVVTNPRKGALNNRWMPVLEKYGLPFIALPEVPWKAYTFKSPLLRLNQIFPKGIEIPEMFIGKNIIHLPTVKTHGHSTTTGAVKNAFGGLLKEVRHYAHKYIHEVLVDLLYMQKELHSGMFCVMDGAVCGDGAGPRTMIPRVQDLVLASGDPVAIDAIAAKVMGFDPLSIPYIRTAHDRGLGVGDPSEIEIVGKDIAGIDFGFKSKRSLVIWGDQMIRRGPLRFLDKILLHSPLMFWAPLASNIYHDLIWYPVIGRRRIRSFNKTAWGRLWKTY